MSENKTKKPVKKRIIITAAVLAIAAMGGIAAYSMLKPEETTAAAVSVSMAMLQKTNLVETISLTGAIYSGNTANIYATRTYPIKEVYVEVGDVVKAGDVLAVLDMADLEYEIQQAENNLTSSQMSAEDSVSNISSSITNAEISLQSSQLNLESAQDSYNTLLEEYNNGTSSSLINAQNSVDNALTALDNARDSLSDAQTSLENNKVLYAAGIIAKSELDSSESAVTTAQKSQNSAETSYQQALTDLETTKKSIEQEITSAKRSLESSQLSYTNAQNSLSDAQSSHSSAYISLENQQLSLDLLKNQLSDVEVVATIDGTITAVNATEGLTPSDNILFVIQDMNDLYVSASVYEYDLDDVTVGRSAIVTTDVTSGSFGAGVDYISPIASSAAGSTTVEFESHTTISDPTSELRIGMNAYVDVILTSLEDVYAVSLAAVTMNANRESVIYVLDDKNAVKEIAVETGLETSTYVEISGDALYDGMIVISNPSGVTVGQVIDMTAQRAPGAIDATSEKNSSESESGGMGGMENMGGGMGGMGGGMMP